MSALQRWALGAGAVVLLATVAPPLDRVAHRLLSVHMTQHLLLLVVVALLFALAVPTSAFPLPRGPWTPLGVATLHLLVVAGWHLPPLYDAALQHRGVHLAEHATLIGVGSLLWFAALRAPRDRVDYPAAVLLLFAAAVAGSAVGVLLLFGPLWYASYQGQGALGDQQLAGVLMWVVGGIPYALAAVLLVVRWLRAVERRAAPAVWLLLALALVACEPVAPLADERVQVERGKVLLDQYGCASCHQIPGVPQPQGRVGPPLGDVTLRRVIAGVLPNTPGNLRAWIRNPQLIEPDTVMPDLGVTPDEADAMVAYLASLNR